MPVNILQLWEFFVVLIAAVLKSHQLFLLRVWDKVISGSCKILVFVALEILLSYKIVLMGMSRPEGVLGLLCNVSKRHKRSCYRMGTMSQLTLASLLRYRRRTRMPLWPKPSTCGTNTAVPPYTPCSTTERLSHDAAERTPADQMVAFTKKATKFDFF